MKAAPFALHYEALKRYKHKPPLYIFKKTRAMKSLLASLFLFDSFPQFSLAKIAEYCGKRSKPGSVLCRKFDLLSIFEIQSIIFLNFVRKCIFACVISIWKLKTLYFQIVRGVSLDQAAAFKKFSSCEANRSLSVLRYPPRCRSPPVSEIKVIPRFSEEMEVCQNDRT